MAKKATSSTPAAKPTAKAPASAKPSPQRASEAKQAEAPPPAKPAKAAVITSKQLAGQLAENHDLPAKQAQAMLDGVVGLLVDHLKAGDKLRLKRLGYPGGEGPSRTHRTQPGHRRGRADCRQQEDRISSGQGTQRRDLMQVGCAYSGFPWPETACAAAEAAFTVEE